MWLPLVVETLWVPVLIKHDGGLEAGLNACFSSQRGGERGGNGFPKGSNMAAKLIAPF